MFVRFARAVTRLNRWIGRWIAWLVLVIFVLLLGDVVARYLIGRPMVWSAELAVLIFGVYGVIGGGYLLAERGHVNVDIVYGNLTVRRKAMADVATSVLFFLFVGILLWQTWSLAADSIERLERSQSVWRPPVWPVKALLPVATLLLLLQGLVRLWADIRVLMGLPVDEDVFGAAARDESRATKAERREMQE